MRGVPVITAVILSAAAVLPACGRQHLQGGANPGAPAAHPVATTPVAATPVATVPATAARCPGGRPATHGKLTITAADSAMSFCVTRGTNVTVFLMGSPGRKWSPIQATGGVLRPSANGEMTLALGVTGASFEAARIGTAYIMSARPDCGPGVPPGDGATGTGSLSCDSIRVFRATVKVIS
jgi:hypothetical protein